MKITRELPVGTHHDDPPVGMHHDPAIGMGLGREIRVGG
ncbi:hypothetical protein NRS6137_00802 [Bacillus subtilis]|nr:hypothetical protein NRS6137_00802 [Bacillus subtilis]